MANRKLGKPAKHTREEWLARALEVLSRSGSTKLRIRDIAKSLGVTTGSFYWHFKGREGFIQALLEYWDRVYTDGAIESTRALKVSAPDRLLVLMQMILKEELSLYDSAFRAWAAQDSKVARFVDRVDAKRLNYASSLFREMGFSGNDLKMRVRLFLVYESNQFGFHDGMTRARMGRLIKMRHEFLTRK